MASQFGAFRKQMNFIASKYFKQNGYSVSKKHSFILESRDDWAHNIIVPEVSEDIQRQKEEAERKKEPFPLHKYLHHGLSSQAMLFNLLGHSLLKNDLNLFKSLFPYEGVEIDSASKICFEHSDRATFNEKQSQPTSFDLAVLNTEGKNVFVEAKLVEPDFGGCSAIVAGNCDGLNPIGNPELCYLLQKKRNYWDIMDKHGLDEHYKDTPICPFAVYYQFYREMMFALENNGYFVMLVDKRNPAFLNGERGLINVLGGRLPEKHKKFFKVLFIQDVLDTLEEHGYRWINEFRLKYGMNKSEQ